MKLLPQTGVPESMKVILQPRTERIMAGKRATFEQTDRLMAISSPFFNFTFGFCNRVAVSLCGGFISSHGSLTVIFSQLLSFRSSRFMRISLAQ